MVRRTGPTPRPGYTMIELLVVILIISILAALTTAAVIKVSVAGKKASAVSEINNLNIALTSFKQKYGLIPPAYVVESDGTGPQVRRFQFPVSTLQPEHAILKRMFQRWNPPLAGGTGPLYDLTTMPPSYQAMVTAGPLDSNQVMVLFLGGPGTLLGPGSGYQTGWDVGGPYAPIGNTRKDPLFDFPDNRMKPESGAHDGRFRDPWGTPYAYFSSNGSNYDPRFIYPWYSTEAPRMFASGITAQPAPTTYTPPTTPLTPAPMQGSFQDPTEPTHLVHPFQSAGSRWVNPNELQIISAGPDRGFGRGLAWTPGAGEYMSGGTGNVGNDDLANFNGGAALGESGQQ